MRAAMVLPRLSNGVAASAAWPCRPDHAHRVCELSVLPLTCCQTSGQPQYRLETSLFRLGRAATEGARQVVETRTTPDTRNESP
jgi:hypothetical protein